MEVVVARKRGRPAPGINGNTGFKKSKQETESFQSGLGSKSKPCSKFFSTSGCQFGDGCHFSHYILGGMKAITQMTGGNHLLPPTIRNPVAPPSFPHGSSPPAVKSRLCSKYNTAEGCKFGNKCHFAHGEWELGQPTLPSSHHENPHSMGSTPGNRFNSGPPRMDFNSEAAAGFGASATAKISVNAALAGPIIGKSGVNSKQICRLTGVKLSIKDNESDPTSKNIELEGTFDQIKQASLMVRELIVNITAASGPPPPQKSFGAGSGTFKTKLCENFTKGSCTFGERCHFAHGAEELRSSGV